jgi:secreted trypsin-like serine protease
MGNLQDPAREAAEVFARSVGGDDGGVYIRLFTAAYNVADALGDARDGVGPRRDRANEVVRATTSIEGPTATRSLPMAGTGLSPGDGPGGSVLDDPAFIENSKYVAPDETRILGGVPAPDFPDCVAVGNDSGWGCTGTLIAPQVVVTAAHCDAGGFSRRIFIGPDVNRPEHGRVVAVREAITHEGYGSSRPFDDITILLLAEPVDGIAPRPLAGADTIGASVSVRLAGFGGTQSSGHGYGMRHMVDVPLASPDPAYGIRPESEFVAGRPFLERDSCPGDSGGPAYVEEAGGWALAGATSRGTPGITFVRKCGDGGIYTHVPAYRDWIDQVTR